MKNPWEVIRRPLVTEKSMASQQKDVYTFMVDPRANKPEIKHAIEVAFSGNKVKVAEVRIANLKGKSKKMRNMFLKGQRKDWKKAYVTLKEGRLDII